MTENYPDSPIYGREAVMIQIDAQFSGLLERLEADLDNLQVHNEDPEGSPRFFMTYPLYAKDEYPMSMDYLDKFDITLAALAKTAGFHALQEMCEMRHLDLFLDHYIQFSDQNPATYVRLVIEGIE